MNHIAHSFFVYTLTTNDMLFSAILTKGYALNFRYKRSPSSTANKVE